MLSGALQTGSDRAATIYASLATWSLDAPWPTCGGALYATPYSRSVRDCSGRLAIGSRGTFGYDEIEPPLNLPGSESLLRDFGAVGRRDAVRSARAACAWLWRAPRNRERSIPAQCSLVAALCSGEVP